MLALYDTAHNKLCGLENYSNYYIEKAIGSGSTPIILDQLHFKYPLEDPNGPLIDYECYISNGDAEFVVKEINLQTADGTASGPTWVEYVCDANIEPIKGTRIDNFAPGSAQAEDAANLALAGTGWVVGYCDVTKTRTVAALTQTTVWDALNAIASMYNCDITFDTINKQVIIHQKIGTDRGAYFAEQLNLKTLQVQGNSRSIVTRLYPRGKNGMTIASANNGVEYVSNYQYMAKVVEAYWTDNRYINAADMLEDADERLDFLSKPLRAYSGAIIDLANASGGKYSLLAYDIGDTIMLLAESVGVREQQRIVKIDQYPDEPERSTCEIANRIVSLDDIILRVSDAADTVSAATDGDGNVLGSSVSVTNKDGTFDPLNVALEKVGTLIAAKVSTDYLQTNYLTATQINSVYATIANLTTNYLTADSIASTYLTAENASLTYATIQNLTANYLTAATAAITYATIANLNAANGNITNLQSDNATIVNLLSNNAGIASLSSDTVQAAYAALATASLGDAQIASLSVAKLLAGTISTTKFTVASDSGNLSISNNTLHVWDTSGKERVALGLNGSDYNLTVRAADGQTTIFGATGVTNAGITQGAVDDSKIAADANINCQKLDQESLITRINGATTLLQSSRIQYDPTGQTLNIAFNNVSTTVNTASTNASNAVSTANTAASNASSAVSTANSASSTASAAASNASTAVSTANTASTNASAAVNTANSANSTASSALSTANSAQSAVTALSQTVTSQGTSLSAVQGQISSKIWQTDITTAVNAVQVGGTNLFLNSQPVSSASWNASNSSSISYISTSPTGSFPAQATGCVKNTAAQSNAYTYQQCTLQCGMQYTATFWVYVPSSNVGDYAINVWYGNNGWVKIASGSVITVRDTWVKTSLTFTTNANYPSTIVGFGANSTTSGNIFYICLSKLEIGNKATDWSPAPEDTATAISTNYSQFTQLINSIGWSVASSTFTNTGNTLSGRMTSAEQKITSDAIVSTVTSSQSWSSMSGTVSTASTTATNALNTANGIQVGGTNLVGKFNALGAISTSDSNILSNGASGWGYVFPPNQSMIEKNFGNLKLQLNTDYVASFIAWCSSGTAFLKNDLYPDDLPQKDITINTTPTKYYFAINSSSSDMSSCRFRFFCVTGNYSVYITDIKLELGNKATDWSPAPQDVQSGISAAQTTANTGVTNASAAQSTANTAVSNASTAQTTANSAVTAAATAQTTANSKSRNFTSTPTVPYYVGDTWTNPSGDVMVCNTARTTGSYTASDWGYASSVTTSTITQLSNNINLKVNSNGVIAAINLSPETATIDAANINLNGLVTAMNGGSYTKINGGAIDTTTLSAAKITTSGSTVYGTIGDISSDGKTGFILRKASDSSNLLRIASGPYGDDGSAATIIDVNGALTIKSDISTTGSGGASLHLYDDFAVTCMQQSGDSNAASLNLDRTSFAVTLYQSATGWTSFWLGVNPSGTQYATIPVVRTDGVMTAGKYVTLKDSSGNTSGIHVNSTGELCINTYQQFKDSEKNTLQQNLGGGAHYIMANGGLNVVNLANSAFAAVTASGFNNGSTAETKTDIHPIDFDCLSAIKSSDMCSFAYRSAPKSTRYGLVIGEGYSTPAQILSDDGCAINMYSMTTVAWQAVKQLAGDTDEKFLQLKSENDSLRSVIADLYGKNAQLENRIAKLERKVA